MDILLRQGSIGPDVELLQLALNRSGYYQGSPDGFFGPATRRAVLSFQSNYGLPADGVVGPKTWAPLLVYVKGFFRKKIVQGDTFWGLAKEFGTTVDAITAANPGLKSSDLRPGQEVTIPLGFPVTPTNITYTSRLNALVVEGLKARYPFLKTGSIGRSVRGMELLSITIGTGPKEVFYSASHHGNEWLTTPVLLKYTEQYAAAYAFGGALYSVPAKTLYETATLYLVPMVNPDGVDLATGALKDGPDFERAKGYAANYPAIPFPTGWKANINGIDTNLQYPANWEQAKEIKFAQGFTSPAPRDYVGPAPLTAPESRAVYRFTEQHSFRLILAYHSQGEIIYWKYLNYLPPRSYEIARMMGDASGYTVEETPAASGYAGYKDWFIQTFNLPGYTIEVGRGVNPLPISQFDRIYEDNIGILTIGITEA